MEGRDKAAKAMFLAKSTHDKVGENNQDDNNLNPLFNFVPLIS
jgi:hypothetical protein